MTRQEFLRLIAGGSAASWVPGARHASADAGVPSPPKSFPHGVTKAIVDFISGTRIDAIPERAVGEAKRCLIDGFGVVLAGASAHGSAIVREYIKSASSSAREATVLGPERV